MNASTENIVTGPTPGPWRVARSVICAGERAVAYCGDEIRAVEGLPYGAERDANARLMAAAPELLDAARAALEQLGNLIGPNAYAIGMATGPITEADFRACKALRAAIAKATQP